MTRRRPSAANLSRYVSAHCKAALMAHPTGWACSECAVVGGKRVSKARLAEQVTVAAQTHPVAASSRAEYTAAFEALYGSAYDD